MKHKGFILELAIDVAIFITCAAICSALTVQANLASRHSERLVRAVEMAQSAAEEYRATGAVPAEQRENELAAEIELVSDSSIRVSIFHDGELIYELEEVPYIG